MFLHPDIIYGPVRSRRLGLSLGVNLLPASRKICTFECVYCECGWTDPAAKGNFPEVEEVIRGMENTLSELHRQNWIPDHITFSGNGEPTLHPAFLQLIRQTLILRNRWTPGAKIAVLTNGTTLNNPAIKDALSLADKCIVKLDAGSENMYRLINIPQTNVRLQSIVDSVRSFGGNCILQSLFLRGEHDGRLIDNTQPAEVTLWIAHIRDLHPQSVMIYSLERIPPVKNLRRIPESELELIARQVRKLGVSCHVY